MTDFQRQVLAVVQAIPAGSTLSYQQVAARAGSPRAYRAVGSILKQNFRPDVPCHRVICADGSLGQYNRGVERKRELLIAEGAESRGLHHS